MKNSIFKTNNKSIFLIFICLFALTQTAFSAPKEDDKDPYIYTDYIEAFNQENLWKKFSCVLKSEGLESLVQKDENIEAYEIACTTNSIELDNALVEDFLTKKRHHAFAPVMSTAQGTLVYASVLGLLLGLATRYLPARLLAMGTGFGGFVVASDIASTTQDLAKQYFKLRNYRGDPLLPYETKYVKRKRFISKALWEKIENRFSSARTTPYGRQEHLNYFDSLFNQPNEAPTPLFLTEETIGDQNHECKFTESEAISLCKPSTTHKQRLLDRFVPKIHKFFDGVYNDTLGIETNKISSAFWTHLTSEMPDSKTTKHGLLAPTQRRPLFLYGPPAVGKTTMMEYFSKEFGIPLVIINLAEASNAEDIFGNKDKPGLLLTGLEETSQKNAILFFDEASETFNNKDLVALLKGLFEPDRGKFHSPFLGVTLDLSKYFIVAAGNAEINDEALASRFVKVNFPNFLSTYLESRAYSVLIPAQLASGTYITSLDDLSEPEKEELKLLISACQNFREMGHRLPQFFNRIEFQRSLMRK